MSRSSELTAYLEKLPSVRAPVRFGRETKGWWVKFTIDIEHKLAWHVVQELGHVMNYVSLEERLPTVFKPVSPPPYHRRTRSAQRRLMHVSGL
ncbi:MAG: hypothetical protein AAFP04_13525 [Myxococcota bacterium]